MSAVTPANGIGDVTSQPKRKWLPKVDGVLFPLTSVYVYVCPMLSSSIASWTCHDADGVNTSALSSLIALHKEIFAESSYILKRNVLHYPLMPFKETVIWLWLMISVGVVHPLNETESPIDVSLKPYGYIASHQSFNFKRTKVVGDKGNLRLRLIGLTRTSTIILQIIFFETETRHPLRVEGILPIPYKIRTGDDRHVVIPPLYDHDVTFRFSYDHYKPFRFSAHRGFFIQYKGN